MANVVLWGNDNNPNFRYEGLARYAFNCGTYGGPNKVAHQAVYNSLFVPKTTEEGLLVLNQILDALIEKENDQNKINEFNSLKESLSKDIGQSTAIDLIDYIIQIIQND